MAELKRSPQTLKYPGPYLAVVKNNLDSAFNGGLEVALIRGTTDDTDHVIGQAIKVKYLSPFAGTTSINFAGKTDTTDSITRFNETQKSYGMWMVPPDVGATVMVFFIEGQISQGYWFGCVLDKMQNQMVPGIGSVTLPVSALDPNYLSFYGTDPLDPSGQSYFLPVAEINKNLSTGANSGPPVHVPFATQLAVQGLLYDRVRGATSSSARREVPSSVFGISTPGPLDVTTNNYQKRTGFYSGNSVDNMNNNKGFPASRLGGNTFVMDDGDANGDNELIRLRTRNGVQILLHNSKDLVYITNSQGTAWIEMTSQGKIDIFAQDSVSIHSEADFNLRADRNFNIEAGQNVNIKAFNNMTIDVSAGLNLLSSADTTIQTANLYVNSIGSVLLTATKEVGLTGSAVNFTGPVQGDSANWSVPNAATSAASKTATNLPLNDLPYNQAGAGWSNSVQYNAGTLSTTMLRMPVHEPWSLHEDLDPVGTNSALTDNTPGATALSTSTSNTPQPLTVTMAPQPASSSWSPALNVLKSLSFGEDGTSGSMANFMQTDPALQIAMQWAADTYKLSTGLPVKITSAYRSPQLQQQFYNAWAASTVVDSNNPRRKFTTQFGWLISPANPAAGQTAPHTQKIAVDTPQAQWLYSHGVLPVVGLSWPLGLKDSVHLTLSSSPSPQE